MKKLVIFVAVATVMLFSSSCSEESNKTTGEPEGTGQLTVTFAFDQPETRADKSNGVTPITTWNNNVKEMMLLLVQGTTIRDVRTIERDNTNTINRITRTFNGIPAGTYDAYIIANYGQTTTPFGDGKISTSAPIDNSLKGYNINNLLFSLVDATSIVGNDPSGSKVMGEPSEVFLAKQTGLTIIKDDTYTHTTPFKLTRAVSLLRVRINQAYDPVTNVGSVDNRNIDFRTAGKTNLRLRLHGTGLEVLKAANPAAAPYGVAGITASAASASNVLYSGKTFKNAAEFTAVANKYKAGADMALSTNDFTLWNEYMMLPGGSATTGALKFNVALGGWAPEGYEAYSPTGNVTVPQGGAMVYWVGQVTGAVAPNGILELNLSLLSAGQIGPDVPPVTDFGNLEISVDLLEWGATTHVPMPL